ncbi:MAG: glycosyl transferase [Clostridiales Family XIII bacterium]|nr:glycosyl transferase [Clostridiales Family XIII bacterium]
MKNSSRKKWLYVPYKLFPKTTGKILYFKNFHKWLKPENLTTFNDKLRWQSLYDAPRNPLMIKCSDKYLVREYVSAKGYGKYLNELFGVWDSPEEIDWNLLPQEFVLKCNHGCGYNIICNDKSQIDEAEVKKELKRWLKDDYGVYNIEAHYSEISRKIICEKYLADAGGGVPPDYKVYCFSGEPKLILVVTDRDVGAKLSVVDTSFTPMFDIIRDDLHILPPPPKCMQELLRCATDLSKDFQFVRVDLYAVNDLPVFGEMTFTPAAGHGKYYTENGNMTLGKMYKID